MAETADTADGATTRFVVGTTENPQGTAAGMAGWGAEVTATWPIPDDAAHVILLRVPTGHADDAVERLGLGARSFDDEAEARRAAHGRAAALGALPVEGEAEGA